MPMPVPKPMSGPVQVVPITALSYSEPALADSVAVPTILERFAPDPAKHLSVPTVMRMTP